MLAVAASHAISCLSKDLLEKLRDNIDTMRAASGAQGHGPVLFIPMPSDTAAQLVVDAACAAGVLVCRIKTCFGEQERFGIRIFCNAAHSRKECERAGRVLKDSCKGVLKRMRV